MTKPLIPDKLDLVYMLVDTFPTYVSVFAVHLCSKWYVMTMTAFLKHSVYLKDVRDRSAIMVCEVKILPVYSPLNVTVK